MNAFMIAYPWMILAFGLTAAVTCVVCGSVAAVCALIGPIKNDMVERSFIAAVLNGSGLFAASVALAFTRWMLTAPPPV